MAVKHRPRDRCGRLPDCTFRSSGLERPVCVVLLPVYRWLRTPKGDPDAATWLTETLAAKPTQTTASFTHSMRRIVKQ